MIPIVRIGPPLDWSTRARAKLHSNPLRPDTKFIRFLPLSHVFIRSVVAESTEGREKEGAPTRRSPYYRLIKSLALYNCS